MARETQVGGSQPSAPFDVDALLALLRERLGDANIQPDGLEQALIKDGAPVGKQKARIHFIQGLTGAGGQREITHSLGRIPGSVRLRQAIPAYGGLCHVLVSPVEYEKWTATTCRVDVLLVGPGSLDGAIIAVEVGDRREE